MVEQDRTMQYTDIQLQFLNLLQKYPVKNPETVVDYVTSQGETVLEDPGQLAETLSECEITPVRRRQILKHWFGEKGVEVPTELIKRVGLPPEVRKKQEKEEEEKEAERRAKYSVDEESGVIKVATTAEHGLTWNEAQTLSKSIKKDRADKGKAIEVKYVYDTETRQVRMARADEQGGTLDQAKELKRMAEDKKEGEVESPFIVDQEGKWNINPKAKMTGIELLALESIRRSQERGEPVDPLEELARATEKMRVYQEALGGRSGMPEWMQDPAKFIEMVRTVAGEPKGDEGLKTEISDLKTIVSQMREEKNKELIENLAKQNQALAGKVDELSNHIAELKRPITGRTEMDIIHEAVSEGIALAKQELPGLRRDIREVASGGKLPPAKTEEERGERKKRMRHALESDQQIEELGQKVFFPGS